MKDFNIKLEQLENEMKVLMKELKTAQVFTDKFLQECSKAGIKLVSVGKRTAKIPHTETFSFGCKGSVFTTEVRDKDGWPAIWGVVSRLDISGGCGNSNQHQVNDCDLMEGVYELRAGKWRRIE